MCTVCHWWCIPMNVQDMIKTLGRKDPMGEFKYPHLLQEDIDALPDRTMSLYVWSEFNPIFCDGIAFALATSEEDAKEQIREVYGRADLPWGSVEIIPITQRYANCRRGCD